MDTKDKIIAKLKELVEWLSRRVNDLESFDKYNQLKSELSSLEKETPALTKETDLVSLKEAIEFIIENPSCDEYVNQNYKHFWNGGQPDDDSMEVDRYWKGMYSQIVDYLPKLLLDLSDSKMAKELYERIYIKDEKDLPKESGDYFVSLKANEGISVWFYATGSKANNWLKYIDWYLSPLSTPKLKHLSDEEISDMAFNHDNSWNESFYEGMQEGLKFARDYYEKKEAI